MHKKHIRWWQEARFGMFIHWGLYTIAGMDCWKMHDMGIPTEEYIAKYEHRFNPKRFDARVIIKLARDAGCKYVVMGTRHHEGYCLWNTKTTRFSSVSMTPKRDFIKEYVQAAREVKLKVGFYYSLLDWRYKAYWDGPKRNPENWRKLVDYVHAQVKELMTQYGKIDILWYDGGWPSGFWGFLQTVDTPGAYPGEERGQYQEIAKLWRSKELNAMVRRLQPHIIINNRSYLLEDFGTPEQKIEPEDRPWELCDTMGDLWGAAPQDLNRKTPREIITRLITCVSKNGNMLLNIGPKADGSIQSWQAKIMGLIGEWIRKHGEALYGCSGEWQSPFNNGLAPWRTTRKGNLLYLHLLRYPGHSFSISNLHDYRLETAEILDTGGRLKITHEPTRDVITGLPEKAPDSIATVIKIRIRYKSHIERIARKNIGLDNPDAILKLMEVNL